MLTCEKCGVELQVGQWPWCPHGHGTYTAIGDELVGGFVQEHFGHEPEIFYSKKAMARRADQLGLQPMIRHVDGDKHVARWV
jgi:hypothetical protein